MQTFGPKETVLAQVLQRAAPPVPTPIKIVADAGAAKKHLVVGLAVVLVLGGGVGGWAATVPISGALIAPGSVVVDTNVKKVQHPTGGVVGEILARDGDTVKAGDVVVRLDETVVKASLAIVAEQQGLDKIAFPPQLTEQARDPDVRDIMASETKLFEVRVNGRTGQKAQLRERLTRLTTLERDAARLSGERAQYIASRAQAKGKITETELQIIQVDKDMLSEVSKDLRETNDKIGEFVERKVTAEDQLRRIEIRAPQDGVVLQSTVHTVGGV
ncbi:HlyD family type I secretion membrane fusion protein, partial [Aduncisulcus paluster]